MEIIIEPPPTPSGMPKTRKSADRAAQQDPMLHALMAAGMSEQSALEQVLRLSAGDIWSG